jgi:two-component system nitrogen regulation response regulator GlnG
VIRLRLPALRERLEDIPMLARHFLQQSAKQLGVEPKRISDAALARLTTFGFPGNVRQLENICHWLTVMAPAQLIEPKDLPPEVGQCGPASRRPRARAGDNDAVRGDRAGARAVPAARRAGSACGRHLGVGWKPRPGAAGQRPPRRVGRAHARFESKLILTALANTRGRRIEAAQKLGIGRNTITRKIQELGLE